MPRQNPRGGKSPDAGRSRRASAPVAPSEKSATDPTPSSMATPVDPDRNAWYTRPDESDAYVWVLGPEEVARG